ncbi:Reticulon-1 like [Actinidia chinensis var. chinensis]|uniref:Reticulon-1 like n=1 Tax=Actinidia chinensis var. chinensis TaxID=1590841 RepID=A0A2R6Q3L3_ACTCC|nr:Reticulon-1 like [Actinidia chinensis var. chinensis]
MGTEVLRPQDCLIERIRVSPAVFNRRKNGNARKPAARPEQKKRFERTSRSEPRRTASLDDLRKNQYHNHHNNLMMGQVTILRRGESLDSKLHGGDKRHPPPPAKTSSDDLAVYGTERLGPDPERIRDLKSVLLSPALGSGDVYAGSAFSTSPSPRSLPLPSFFNKKQVSKVAGGNDPATRDLRRLLRLD